MTHKINITIPKPCHENWLEMSVTEKGRFCENCQKDVIDFTNSTDREILTAYNKSKNLCGQFRVSQLDRDIIIPKEKKSIWMISAASVIAFLGLGTQTATAQGNVRIEQTNKKNNNNDKSYQSEITLENEITGTVKDSIYPLPAALIENSRTKIKIDTDFDGNFKIKAQKGDEIIITYLGMKTYKFITNDTVDYTINMFIDPLCPAPKEIIVGAVCPIKKRSFLTRIFH
jgi:hypothetical protein